MIDPVALIFLLCAIALLAGVSIKRIPEGHVYTLHRLGRPQLRLLMPGTRLVVPLFERVRHKISLTGRTLRLDTLEGHPGARATVYWQVLDAERADAVIEEAETLIRERLLQALAGDTADADNATARNSLIKRAINAKLQARGLLATRVDLRLD
jgi:regulator of protease activity HflC (stomatin/prohibitin superfamily)